MDILDKLKGKASTGHVEALEADLKRLDEERRRLEDEQKAFRDFVERLRRAKDQDE